MLIDTHCHLQFKPFSEDLDLVLKRAHDNGVDKFLCVGCCVETSDSAHLLSLEKDKIYASQGIHPCSAKTFEPWVIDHFYNRFKNNPKLLAVGEIGLDYYHDDSFIDVQHIVFKEFIKLAKELDLPMIIHIRDKNNLYKAYDDALMILDEVNYYKGVVHCFSGNLEYAKKFWHRGIMTSFTGIITYKNVDGIRESVKHVPEHLFMIETDSPYLPPNRSRKDRCEPAYVKEVAEEIASIKDMKYEDIKNISYNNAIALFKF